MAPHQSVEQTRHPVTGRWIKIDTDTGRVLAERDKMWKSLRLTEECVGRIMRDIAASVVASPVTSVPK